MSKAVTREKFDKLKPYQQGYVSYWQGAWNKEISEVSPYEKDSKQDKEFSRGVQAAIIDAQDSEED